MKTPSGIEGIAPMTPRQRLARLVEIAITVGLGILAARFGIPPGLIQLPPLPVNVPPTINIQQPPATIPPGVFPGGLPIIPPPTVTVDPPTPTVKLDPVGATVKLIANGHYCTATIIGPRGPDGKQLVLTAAHCFASVGEVQSIQCRDGRKANVACLAIYRGPDYAWAATEPLTSDMTYTLLFDGPPRIGQEVYHTGYGVHRPGNRETGKVASDNGSQGRFTFDLRCSHGDSGSGIIDKATGKVVGVVSTGSGRDPSPWTGGPTTPTIHLPDGSTPDVSPYSPCPGGICPIG